MKLYLNETNGFIVEYFHLGVSLAAVLISTNKDQQHCTMLVH